MRLHFLGTGGYHPNERRHTACLMLPELGVIFDAGTGSFRVPARLATSEIDLFLSHAHVDHIVGLTYYLVPLLTKALTRATVHGDPACLDAVRAHLFAAPIFPVVPEFEFRPLAERVPLSGGYALSHRRLNHPGGSIGFRLDGPGASLAYITDTVADGTYRDFIQGVDVLVHECYFPDDRADWADATGHSFTSAVAHLANDAGVGRLFLVHVDPQRTDDDPIGMDVARGIFPETRLAEDNLEIDL